jgi:hypothetical protein
VDVRVTVKSTSSKAKDPGRIFELDQRLHDIYKTIASLSSSSFTPEPGSEFRHYQTLLLHAIYHICQIVLHSSVLRIFSGQEPVTTVSPSISSICARQVLSSASSFAELVQALLESADMTRIPPFVAYTAFISGCVFKTLVAVQTVDAQTYHAKHFESCDRLIGALSRFWPVLQRMERQLSRGALFPRSDGSFVVLEYPGDIREEDVTALATCSPSRSNMAHAGIKFNEYCQDVTKEQVSETILPEEQGNSALTSSPSLSDPLVDPKDPVAFESLLEDTTSGSFMAQLGIGFDEVGWLLGMGEEQLEHV